MKVAWLDMVVLFWRRSTIAVQYRVKSNLQLPEQSCLNSATIRSMDEWNRYALVLDYRWSQDLATVDGIKNNIMLSVYASSSQELLCSVLLIVHGTPCTGCFSGGNT